MTLYPQNIVLRLVILALSFVGFATWYVWGHRTKHLPEASLVFLWLLNVAAFHIYRLFFYQPNLIFLNNWSLGIHLQAVLSLAVVGVMLARGKYDG